jgi:hypothetical protein
MEAVEARAAAAVCERDDALRALEANAVAAAELRADREVMQREVDAARTDAAAVRAELIDVRRQLAALREQHAAASSSQSPQTRQSAPPTLPATPVAYGATATAAADAMELAKLRAEAAAKDAVIQQLVEMTRDSTATIEELREHAVRRKTECTALRHRATLAERRLVDGGGMAGAEVTFLERRLQAITGPVTPTERSVVLEGLGRVRRAMEALVAQGQPSS